MAQMAEIIRNKMQAFCWKLLSNDTMIFLFCLASSFYILRVNKKDFCGGISKTAHISFPENKK
jgi:hypothetical protein